jgi:hypothetical protein
MLKIRGPELVNEQATIPGFDSLAGRVGAGFAAEAVEARTAQRSATAARHAHNRPEAPLRPIARTSGRTILARLHSGVTRPCGSGGAE